MKVHELLLNYACTAKCPFCYNPPLTPELLRRDLDFDAAARSLYAAAAAGARALNLHGGEPTLRDDLPKLLALARKLGFARVTVVTNGVRLGDPAYARELVECGATHFRVSLHGPAEINDAILAIPGGTAKAEAGLRNLAGASVGLNVVLIKANLAALPAHLERFTPRHDVIVYFPHQRGMMELNRDQAPSYAQAAAAVRAALARSRRDNVRLANFVPCLLPEAADLMLDWTKEHDEPADMLQPGGKRAAVRLEKDAKRVKVDACRRCEHDAACLGVEREYAAEVPA